MGGPTRSPAPPEPPRRLCPPLIPCYPQPVLVVRVGGDVGGGAREVAVAVVVVVVVGMVVRGGGGAGWSKKGGTGAGRPTATTLPGGRVAALTSGPARTPTPRAVSLLSPRLPPPSASSFFQTPPTQPGPARPGHRRPPTHLGRPSPGPPFPGGRYLQRPVRRAAPRR